MKWLIFIWLLLYELFISGCANPNAKQIRWQYQPVGGVVQYNGNRRSEMKSRIMAINTARAYCNGSDIEVIDEHAQETEEFAAAVGNPRGNILVPIKFHDRFMFMQFKCRVYETATPALKEAAPIQSSY